MSDVDFLFNDLNLNSVGMHEQGSMAHAGLPPHAFHFNAGAPDAFNFNAGSLPHAKCAAPLPRSSKSLEEQLTEVNSLLGMYKDSEMRRQNTQYQLECQVRDLQAQHAQLWHELNMATREAEVERTRLEVLEFQMGPGQLPHQFEEERLPGLVAPSAPMSRAAPVNMQRANVQVPLADNEQLRQTATLKPGPVANAAPQAKPEQNASSSAQAHHQAKQDVIGTWWHGSSGVYEVCYMGGKLWFEEAIGEQLRRGELAENGSQPGWLVANLYTDGQAHGAVRLRLKGSQLISQFRPLGSNSWSAKAIAERETFDVNIHKANGTSLGIDVDAGDGITILIEGIREGLVEAWNSQSTGPKVKIGDRITKVNLIRANAPQMVHELQKKQKIQMRVVSCRGSKIVAEPDSLPE